MHTPFWTGFINLESKQEDTQVVLLCKDMGKKCCSVLLHIKNTHANRFSKILM